MQTGLEGKPWYIGLGVGLLVGALAVFAGYRVKLGPMKEEIESQDEKLADLQRQIQRGEAAKQSPVAAPRRVGSVFLPTPPGALLPDDAGGLRQCSGPGHA